MRFLKRKKGSESSDTGPFFFPIIAPIRAFLLILFPLKQPNGEILLLKEEICTYGEVSNSYTQLGVRYPSFVIKTCYLFQKANQNSSFRKEKFKSLSYKKIIFRSYDLVK